MCYEYRIYLFTRKILSSSSKETTLRLQGPIASLLQAVSLNTAGQTDCIPDDCILTGREPGEAGGAHGSMLQFTSCQLGPETQATQTYPWQAGL